MITVRRSEERGHSQQRWLDSRHSFSFGSYQDPRHMGCSVLRVINEDRVAPGAGFAPHTHDNMEILTCVLAGAVTHRDSMGNEVRVGTGELQLMSAGTGVIHSEFNRESDELHFLQVWLYPDTHNTEPGYQQRRFPEREGLQLVVSPDGAQDSLRIRQKARVWRGQMAEGDLLRPALTGKNTWLQVLRGHLVVEGSALHAGDGACLREEPDLTLAGGSATVFLLFDLP